MLLVLSAIGLFGLIFFILSQQTDVILVFSFIVGLGNSAIIPLCILQTAQFMKKDEVYLSASFCSK